MNRLRIGSLCIFTILALACVSRGQDSSDLEAFRKLQTNIENLIDTDELKQAKELLDAEAAKDPDSADVSALRHFVAARLLNDRDFAGASEQYREILDFQIAHIDALSNQYGLWMTIKSMKSIARRGGSSQTYREALDRAFAAITDTVKDDDRQALMPRSQIALMKAHQLINDDSKDKEARKAEGLALADKYLVQLGNVNEEENATERTMTAFVRMLQSMTTEERGNDAWREEHIKNLEKVTEAAIAMFPESRSLQMDYAETQMMMITQWEQDDPKKTKERIKLVSKQLEPLALRNRSLQTILRRIDVHESKLSSAKSASSLVGTEAPAWEIDAWVNNASEQDEASLKGKVILLDFWAMWCGPCVATFPHLRELREEFGDKGFEIVGVTQYYNYEWNEEESRASRSQDEVAPEDERETLAKFLEHHKLEHPVIVAPKGSKMSSEYGVRGIPHMVLIDQEGKIQMVKVGAGQATADAIHAKVKELLEGEPQQQ